MMKSVKAPVFATSFFFFFFFLYLPLLNWLCDHTAPVLSSIKANKTQDLLAEFGGVMRDRAYQAQCLAFRKCLGRFMLILTFEPLCLLLF